MDVKLKRIGAYVVDYLLVILFVSLVSEIRFINPYLDDYVEAYETYEKASEKMLEGDINELARDKYFQKSYYNVFKYGVVTNVVSVVVYVLYFGIFQKWNKGQSLGKKMFRIKVISEDGKDASWLQMVGRCIIIYNLMLILIGIGLVFWTKSTIFFWSMLGINFVGKLVTWISLLLIMTRKDEKGLHDLLFKTKVVLE